MKYITKGFLALCLLLGVGAVTASAQIESDVTVKANIPQAFVVNDTTLPAGKYTIRVVEDTALDVLEIRSEDGRTAVLFNTDSAEPKQMPNKTELVFDKVGDTYFLSQIFVEGDDTGNQLIKSRMERKLEGDGLKSEKHSMAALITPASKSAKN
jgi:hypothetical protein